MKEITSYITQKMFYPQMVLKKMNQFELTYNKKSDREFKKKETSVKLLAPLFDSSDSISSYLHSNPTIADMMIEKYDINLNKDLQSIDNDIYSDLQHSSEIINRYKYIYLGILTSKYLLGEIDTPEFGSLWSKVAFNCCEIAYQIADKNLQEIYGIRDRDKSSFKFCIIALGKLGAEELNYSSDLDILFIYDGQIKQSADDTPTTKEYATKLAKKIIRILDGSGKSRRPFRIDSNLRPEGCKGLLVNSLDTLISYYQYFGSELERMMLIRAKPAAGDLNLGNDFVRSVRPFVYRKSLDITSLQKIQDMKEKIINEAEYKNRDKINIKLGNGGIRELEFIIQSLQLIHGGKKPVLMSNNTLKALKEIKRENILPTHVCNELKAAYLYLRRTENMIQLPQEAQKHALPTSKKEMKSLAFRIGYEEDSCSIDKKFLSDLHQHIDNVQKHFQFIFNADYEKQEIEEAILVNISKCNNTEEKIDSIPWFRKEETKRIQFLDLEKELPIEDVSRKLSIIAEVILAETLNIANKELNLKYGYPVNENGKSASMAIIGMGKLGGRELDYGSDLDIMFVYSDKGKTTGPKEILNAEFFTKLSQRIISLISTPTRYGRAYAIDADLRPSGKAGILVTPIDAFITYHLIEADIWEQQALIKASPIAGDNNLIAKSQRSLEQICYEKEVPKNIKDKINHLRMRVEKESANEDKDKYNLKLGLGGLMDIDTIVQYLQLIHGRKNKHLRVRNTLQALEHLGNTNHISQSDKKTLTENYKFLKKTLGRIRLFYNHTTDYLTADHIHAKQTALSLGYRNIAELLNDHLKRREIIRNIYINYMT